MADQRCRQLYSSALGLVLLAILVVQVNCDDDQYVTSISPRDGGTYGGVALTLHGKGFAKNLFNGLAGTEHLGNSVVLVSSTRSYVCDVHKDGCNEFQIVCFTRPMVDGDYYVKVKVDGVELPDESLCSRSSSYCRFRPKSYYTPHLSSISPLTTPPGAIITLDGKIMTSLLGSHEALSTNGNEKKLLRVYAGGQKCETMKDSDLSIPFGIELDSDGTSQYGSIKCHMLGSYISNVNASFLIEAPYGSSNPDNTVLRVFADDSIAMMQTYARVDSVNPSSGSVEGGTQVTITGQHFDNTNKPLDVQIAGTACDVTDMTDTSIVCVTAPKPADSVNVTFRGGRGLDHHVYYDTQLVDLDDLSSLDALTYNTTRLDVVSFDYDSTVTTISQGLLVPTTTSEYSFEFEGMNCMAKLLLSSADNHNDLEDVFSKTFSSKRTHHHATRYTLEAGKQYYIKIVHTSKSNSANSLSFGFRMYTTSKTEAQTGAAVNEKQRLTMTSTIVPETQTVSFKNWVEQTSVNEVQTVDVIKAVADEIYQFRLGVDGIYTAFVSTGSAGSVIEAALDSLPTVAPDTVSVVHSEITGGDRYTITFNSGRGYWPLITGQDPGALTITATRVTAGVASLTQAVLAMNGVPTQPISTSATTTQVQEAIEDLFSVRCHGSINFPSGGIFKETFEGKSLGYDSTHRGYVIINKHPMCGRNSIQNPSYIINTSPTQIDQRNRFVCFGYNGFVTNVTTLSFEYLDGTEIRSTSRSFTIDLRPYDGKWHHSCFDAYKLISDAYVDGKYFRLTRVWIGRDYSRYTQFDNIYLGSKNIQENDLDSLRLMPPRDYLMNDVQVTSTEDMVYTIKLFPVNCSSPFSSLSAKNGPNEITRDDRASIPVSGTFDLQFGDSSTKGIPANVEAEGLQARIESLSNSGGVLVYRTGLCHSYVWNIEWLQDGGDRPTIVLNTSKIQGVDADIQVLTSNDGYVMFKPALGDMVFQAHENSQVTVDVNGIPTHCNGSCEFTWSDADTPTVTSISPQTGGAQVTLTIDGTGFDTNMEVYADEEVCSNVAITGNQLTCDLDLDAVGVHKINVFVIGKGKAVSTATYTYASQVNTVTPNQGHLSGGYFVTLDGSGLTSGMKVEMLDGAVECLPISTNSTTSVICQMSPANAAGVTDIRLIFPDGSELNVTGGFTFSSAVSSSVITSLSTTTASVAGGTVLTVSGSGFGVSSNDIGFDGGISLVDAVTSWADDSIALTLPSLPVGNYVLLITTGDGYADLSTNSISPISYTLSIDSISPTIVSQFGGTSHVLTGDGFGTDASKLDVRVGGLSCVVGDMSNTQLSCVTTPQYQTHTVTNKGSHVTFGEFYVWDKTHIVVEVGDWVTWTWTPPPETADVKYTVQQLEDLAANSALENGFGFKNVLSRSGQYSYQFTEEGEFYYWSNTTSPGYSLRGTVEVKAKAKAAEDVILTLAGQAAENNLAAAGRKRRSVITKRSACVAEEPTCSTDSVGSVGSCTDPPVVVTEISPNQGTSQTVITITGTGFSTTPCNNIVLFGDTPCVIESANDTQLECKLDIVSPVEAGALLAASVKVNNLGYAQLAITGEWNKGFKFLPHISAISHSNGSLCGGQLLTITGDGFMGDGMTKVAIGFSVCEVLEVKYYNLTCQTEGAAAWSGDMEVKVLDVNNDPLSVECIGDGVCSYTYGDDSTPSVASYSPSEVSGSSTEMVIQGSLFGTDVGDVTVTIGSADCAVTSVNDSMIECTVGTVAAGTQSLYVNIAPLGIGTCGSLFPVTSIALVSSISPSSGSIHGGQSVTISGSGFTSPSTVNIGGASCEVVTAVSDTIVCETSAHAEGSVSVEITSVDGEEFPATTYNYTADDTPAITAISPTSGYAGEALTITGTQLSDNPTVDVGGVACSVLAVTSEEVVCTLGNHAAGMVDIVVSVDNLGDTNSDSFTFTLDANSVTPATGSFGGGQLVEIDGAGFDETVQVTICGEVCAVDTATLTSSLVKCVTPSTAVQVSNLVCDVVISLSTETKTLTGAYTYDPSLGGTISGVSPSRGGTAGGTSLTISGSSLNNHASAEVTIDGVQCVIQSRTDTQIICRTDPHVGTIEAEVLVSLGADGLAVVEKGASVLFYYVDVWSSVYTWGGGPLPEKGDLVEIPQGQTLLLDTDTPVLKVLLIRGSLIFDDKDVELQAENILIVDGGKLQVGTEDEPFQHKGIITMHGHLRSLEMPIYGAKTLGVRNGTLDLHGIPKEPWTVLGSTAAAGATQIVLERPVHWVAGDRIVIASTGKRHSQKENEEREIASISADGLTLTLTEALEYEHLGVTADIGGGHKMEMRAEVGLLTHNVVFRGSVHMDWEEVIPACPAGFDTGQFATQTCFQGRFGEEMGSDEFGAAIMMHAPEPDMNWAVGRLSHIEVTHAGQAFRLGRYPIHFHLNGHQNGSYVRGCSVHRTFNRAINIHNTHDILIEHNVIYHIMGGAVFLEDSIETGNILQYNLAVFVISSTSLLNDDITPAAYWLTHPSNIVRHNHAAGGSHFAFWYRMHSHPTGPSTDSSLCPKNAPLTEFRNNTAHSLGWFGLWTFEDYYPMDGDGVCSQSKVNIPAVFHTLTAWHCEKGAEYVNGGDLQFDGFVLANNEKAGFEGKINKKHTPYSDVGPVLKNSIVAAGTDSSTGCTARGIILPFSEGFMVDNVDFVGFNSGGCAAIGVTTIDGKCTFGCGGWTYKFKNITWTDSDRKAAYRWEHEAAYEDLDGTLTGIQGAKVVPYNPSLDPAVCANNTEWSRGSFTGSVCNTPFKFHRYAWNNQMPSSLQYKNALLQTSHGVSAVPFLPKRLTHKEGWMCMMMGGEKYNLNFENGEQFTNTSNTGVYYDFDTEDYLIVEKQLYQRPDRFQVAAGPEQEGSETPLTSDNFHGDWHISHDLKFSYIVSGKDRVKKRSTAMGKSRAINFKVYTCYFNDCIPPPDPNTVPPPTKRPADAIYWSKGSSWDSPEEGSWETVEGTGTAVLPTDGGDITILNDHWTVLDTQPATLNRINIYGVLEFEPAMVDGAYIDYKLSATHILLFGGRLYVGWEDNPMRGNVEIILRGDWSTEEQYMPFGGPTVGAKAIGVFGSLDIHGLNRSVYWTKLALQADIGDDEIVLVEEVDWVVSDEIVITTTGKSPWESEVRKITEVRPDGKTLVLNDTLLYKHLAVSYTSGSRVYEMTAEVGLLTRNVKVIGHEHDLLQAQSFGGRILIGQYFDGERDWIGSARIENVEFYHMGQEGYIDSYDPRFAVAYLETGTVSDIKPSYVRRNSFKDSFNTAIGVFDGEGIEVVDNVIHSTVEAGIRAKSTNISIERNLVSFAQARACYQEREETTNIAYHGSIEIMDCISGVTLRDNAVAGSERTGYAIAGVRCSEADVPWTGNVAHGTLSGVVILPEYITPSPCTRITGFTVYHTLDYGIYVQASASIEIDNVVVADNNLGILPLVIGPSALSHVMGDRYVKVSDSLIVGSTAARDCDLDYRADPDNCNRDVTLQARSWNSPTGGSVGMGFGQFMSGSNLAPFKPWKGLMSYNSNRGLTIITNVTFENFGIKCDAKRDYAISTSPSNEDGQHPVVLSEITLNNVDEESKLFFHRPNVGKINSADCVDMDCDAKKKCMVKDKDGSFFNLGPGGAAIPQSEWEWESNPQDPRWPGDPRRGLGDYRIPKTLLTVPVTGERIPVNNIAPNKGIIGNNDCEWVESWTAYKCKDYDYEMIVIESLDSDTETRRLSPVAVLGDGYVDLINGPQDHGWCSGYTCRKRVSTFLAIVATGKHYALYFTSTSPQKLRLTMINALPTDKITLEIFYEISNRIDVYVDDAYVRPENTEMEDGEMKYLSPTDRHGCEFCPKVNSSNGANFQNRWRQLFYVTLSGEAPVDIKMSDMIMLTFDLVMSEDDFFGEELTNNLAIFFDVPKEKIRVVNVIPEDSPLAKRRKRAIDPGHIVVQIEIGGTPTLTLNETATDGLSLEELNALRVEIIDAAQTGVLAAELGIPYSSIFVSVPLPDPSDPAWGNLTAEVEEDGIEIKLPNTFNFAPQPASTSEGKQIDDINVQLVNSDGDIVNKFGDNEWAATIELIAPAGSESAVLYGANLSSPIVDGWVNFTNLTISTSGEGYTMKIYVSSPANMTHIMAVSDAFDIERRQIEAVIAAPQTVNVDEQFNMGVDLVEKGSNTPFSHSNWLDMNFAVYVTLNSIVNYTGGELVVATNWAVVDPEDGSSLVSALSFTQMNAYVLDIEVKSAPDASYGFTTTTKYITVYPVGYVEVSPVVTRVVTLSFTGESELKSENTVYFEVTLFNHFLHSYENISLGTVDCSQDLECEIPIAGEVDTVEDTILSLYKSITESLAIKFANNDYAAKEDMKVDGEKFHGPEGPTVPPVDEDETNSGLPLWVIILVACCAVLVVAIIIVAVVIAKMKANAKVSESPRTGTPFDLEESLAYVGAPPTSTKLPQLETRKVEEVNEKQTSQKKDEQSFSRHTRVKPLDSDRKWKY